MEVTPPSFMVAEVELEAGPTKDTGVAQEASIH